ncbi:MAG: cobyrinate a,c-diamide synthase [Pikeienuella sp.]
MTDVLLIAAPASGAGKTTITLGLLRALRDRGVAVSAGKSGPDYIDPQFHAAALRAESVNLDAWAMTPDALRVRGAAQGGELLLVEGAVGLLDGAGVEGRGSSADLASALGAPVVMVVDAARSAHSAALSLAGARALRPDLVIAGAILNRVGSPRHAAMARRAVEAAGFAVFGTIPRNKALETPSRHLGLVQAQERADIEPFIAGAAGIIAEHIDLDALHAAAEPLNSEGKARVLPPLGQRIAVARDVAFAFAYPHLLNDWRSAGAEVSFFSPLADEAPDEAADAVFLPGGYPELHAAKIASADRFKAGMGAAQNRGALIYGECGGYMVLGEALIDADGASHEMLGMLDVVTSFATRKLTLGYRRLEPRPGAPWDGALMAHEFHYSTIVRQNGVPLFDATDADGADVPAMGLINGRVFGSYGHIIAPSSDNSRQS